MEFRIVNNEGEHVANVESVEIQKVELEVDTFPEYFTEGEIECEINFPFHETNLKMIKQYYNRMNYIVKEV